MFFRSMTPAPMKRLSDCGTIVENSLRLRAEKSPLISPLRALSRNAWKDLQAVPHPLESDRYFRRSTIPSSGHGFVSVPCLDMRRVIIVLLHNYEVDAIPTKNDRADITRICSI
jgi:hypothetical protein